MASAGATGTVRHALADQADVLLQQALGFNASTTSTTWAHLIELPFNVSSAHSCDDLSARRREVRASLAALGINAAQARVGDAPDLTALSRGLDRCLHKGAALSVVTMGCSMSEGQSAWLRPEPTATLAACRPCPPSVPAARCGSELLGQGACGCVLGWLHAAALVRQARGLFVGAAAVQGARRVWQARVGRRHVRTPLRGDGGAAPPLARRESPGPLRRLRRRRVGQGASLHGCRRVGHAPRPQPRRELRAPAARGGRARRAPPAVRAARGSAPAAPGPRAAIRWCGAQPARRHVWR